MRQLTPLERAAWDAGYHAAVEAGIWRPQFVLGLEVFAGIVAMYVRLAQTGLPADTPELEDYHELARQQAFQWHLVDTEAPPPLRPDGLDPDLARICGLDRHLSACCMDLESGRNSPNPVWGQAVRT